MVFKKSPQCTAPEELFCKDPECLGKMEENESTTILMRQQGREFKGTETVNVPATVGKFHIPQKPLGEREGRYMGQVGCICELPLLSLCTI